MRSDLTSEITKGPGTANRYLAFLPLAAVGGAGCSLATNVRQNTDAIAMSSATIGTNTRAVSESTSATGSLVPALQGVERLRGSMESVAALDPTLRSVASLNEPMTRVAALDKHARAGRPAPAMTRLVAIGRGLEPRRARRPMAGVADMRPSLDAVAGLEGSLDMVGGLQPLSSRSPA